AESSCYVRVYHVGKEPNQNEFYEMFGEYKDNWRKINNSWFIMQRKLIVNYERGNRDKVLAP
ncbi:MAG: nuclear transport factor 2 family protein, partial [Gammaproteobacteria bacterium]